MPLIDSNTATINAVRMAQQSSDPSAPSSGGWKLYFKSGGLYIENAAGTVVGPLSTGGGSITSTEAILGADVTMTTSGTWYDAVTLSLAAGTWFLLGTMNLDPAINSATSMMAAIYDGTNSVAVAQNGRPAASGTLQAVQFVCTCIVSPSGTTTYHFRAVSEQNGSVIRAETRNLPVSLPSNVTRLEAIKLA